MPSLDDVSLDDDGTSTDVELTGVVESDKSDEVTGPPPGRSIHFDNLLDLFEEIRDPEVGEPVMLLFGFVTTKNVEGDEKLEIMSAAMKAAGLYFHSYDAKSGSKSRITRIGATKTRLIRFADAIDYMTGLNPEKVEKACQDVGLILKNPKEKTQWYKPYDHLSGAFEIQKQDLYNEFTSGDFIKLIFQILVGSTNFKDDAKGCGFDITKLNSTEADDEFCLGFFPLHEEDKKQKLADLWLPLDWPWKLPTYEIKEYFGEEIAFYFGFLGHLTTGLLPIIPFALICAVLSFIPSFKMNAEAIFAIFATCVYSIILDYWRYEQSKLAHQWHVFGCLQSLPPRPGFQGIVMANPMTGDLEFDFPDYMRAPRKFYSFVLSSSMIFALIITVASIFLYKSILVSSGSSQGMLLVPALLNAVQITIFGFVYGRVAKVMTDYENHKTAAEHNSALFKKLTLFYFVNNYATLFYIAFIKEQFEGCIDPLTGGTTYCGLELSMQVAVVFLVNDFFTRIGNSLILPFLLSYYAAYSASHDDSMKAENMGPIEKQYVLLSPYAPSEELILDYIELFIQWGYLVLFGASFPIAVIFACLTNYVETRTDGHKLFKDFRRVVPNRVDGIGEPLSVLYYTLFCAVPVNAGLVIYTFNANPFDPSYDVWVFIAICILIVLVIGKLDDLYPDVPEKTRIQLGREERIFDRIILENEGRVGDLKLDLAEDMIGKSVKEVKLILKERAPPATLSDDAPQGSKL